MIREACVESFEEARLAEERGNDAGRAGGLRHLVRQDADDLAIAQCGVQGLEPLPVDRHHRDPGTLPALADQFVEGRQPRRPVQRGRRPRPGDALAT